jgi:hypothetical protein
VSKASEVEQDVATLIGSEVTGIGYENGAMVLEFGTLEIRIGADTPIWCIVKEYTVQ